MKLACTTLLLLFLMHSNEYNEDTSSNYKACACDTLIAKKIVIKAFYKHYGFFHTIKYKPYIITAINDSTWTVSGTLHTDIGGTPKAWVDKRDCTLIKVIHYK